MIQPSHQRGEKTARMIRAFISSYDGSGEDRQIASQIKEKLHSELYRREREHYSEWIDHGGEA